MPHATHLYLHMCYLIKHTTRCRFIPAIRSILFSSIFKQLSIIIECKWSRKREAKRLRPPDSARPTQCTYNLCNWYTSQHFNPCSWSCRRFRTPSRLRYLTAHRTWKLRLLLLQTPFSFHSSSIRYKKIYMETIPVIEMQLKFVNVVRLCVRWLLVQSLSLSLGLRLVSMC